MSGPVINIGDLPLDPLPPELAPTGDAAERYAPRIARPGRVIGATQLGYSVIALAPGKRAFPFHNHRVNEEMFFVLEGTGEARIGDARYPLRPGDVIACPAGGRETAHQIANTGDTELRYLAVSTQQSPDVVEYPHTDRYAVLVAEKADTPGLRAIGRTRDSLDYWSGE
jgi:uncharacterized cupin superfamily protein